MTSAILIILFIIIISNQIVPLLYGCATGWLGLLYGCMVRIVSLAVRLCNRLTVQF